MLTPYLQQIYQGNTLNQQDAESAMHALLTEADPYQTSAFLALLKYRGESPEEVVGMIKALEQHSIPVSLSCPTLDIVGTGGDGARTVNISTGAAILAAACGIPIAKHGNRSVSSASGSADVLEALGIPIELSCEKNNQALSLLNIIFLFAPQYHPFLKKIKPIRQGLKILTVFHILGPLINPARSQYALIGVSKPELVELVAQVVLQLNNKKRALVFHGSGLDELTTLGKIIACDIHEGQIRKLEIDPLNLGFTPCSLCELQGGDAKHNAFLLQEVFSGKKGAIADALVFTAGTALWIYNATSSLQEGIELAKRNLEEGKALDLLNKWRAFGHMEHV